MDHLVAWVSDYLVLVHGEAKAKEILDDIDRRLAAGRDFAQWTGDDSKALMKIYIAAIAGHVPERMVKALSAYLDFCFLARRNAITSTMLAKMDDALSRFYEDRQIFMDVGVRVDISLPRQHALKHYIPSILLFGSPNGLCSSITDSKHIKAVKEPWRRSNRYNALGQMLTTNVRLDKMHAARLLLEKRGMMIGTTASYTAGVLDGVRPAPIRSNPADEDSEDEDRPGLRVPLCSRALLCPSDLCGAGGVRRERIRSTPSWYGCPRRDTVLIDIAGDEEVLKGMNVGRDLLFMSFKHNGRVFPCALIHCFVPVADTCDRETGMWVVRPEYTGAPKKRMFSGPKICFKRWSF
ncbi:hypothetical protein EV715DRAFT_275614 [Schizophyllum commune]